MISNCCIHHVSNCAFVFNRQLIFRAVVPRLRWQQTDDEGELTDPLPDKLRSSIVRNCSVYSLVYHVQMQMVMCLVASVCASVCPVRCNVIK